jgi:AcrR family transcriptional regulator
MYAVATSSPVGSPAPARPLRRDAEANRRQILEAASRLMTERGLAAPLEDIAAAAGVGIGTLYRRFPTRADLIEAVFQDHLGIYIADLEESVAMADGWEAFLHFLERATARQISDRALNELVEHDLGEESVRQVMEKVTPLVETLVTRAKQTGRLRPDFSVSDLAFLQQMLVALGSATASFGDRVWKRYMIMMVDGLVVRRDEPTPAGGPALSIDEMHALHASRPGVPWRRSAQS